MKKIPFLNKTITALAVIFVVLGTSSLQAEAANGNAYGLYANPGNSLYGRSHNPNYSPYVWNGLRFDTLEDLIDYMRLYYGNISTGTSDVKAITKSATNIDTDEATLRGELKMGSSDYANVWFMYGTKQNYLVNTTATGYIDDDGTTQFSGTVTNLKKNTTYYFKAVGEDEDGDRSYGSVLSFRTGYNSNDDNDDNENYDVDVETNSVKNIEEDSAKVTGEVDMNDLSNGVVFIVYGTDKGMVEDVEDDFDSYNDIDEDGDDLRKMKVDSDLDGTDSYSETIDDLEDDTRYYVAYGVAYEDEDGDEVITLGNIRSFYTDDSNDSSSNSDDEEPYVRTDGTDDIEEDTAKIYGYVDMNDFEDGTVFFVFGENRDELLDVQNEYDSYDDIDEDGDDIQKIKVYTNLDSKGTLEGELYGLDSDTTIYYIIGVEYEDEDGDSTLRLGAIRSFVTEE